MAIYRLELCNKLVEAEEVSFKEFLHHNYIIIEAEEKKNLLPN